MLQITDIPVEGYENVKRALDRERGLHALISVHSTVLGPSLGGMRLWPFATVDEALTDVLRLSKGMTYKAACAGLNLGGGKAVIIGEPEDKSEDLYEAMGEFIETFGGSYLTAEDVNTSPDDLRLVARKTGHVTGLVEHSGDPSPYTARGCFLGLEATLEEIYGSADMGGKRFAVEGVGAVGAAFARMIHGAGGQLVVADIRAEAAEAIRKDTGAEIVDADAIYDVECDVFAPCALGASVRDETIDRLRCRAIVGAANNQLAELRHGDLLRERGILYAPDFLVNAGGLINIYNEIGTDYDEERALGMMRKIHDNLREIYRISSDERISTASAAERFAERRLEAARAAQPSA